MKKDLSSKTNVSIKVIIVATSLMADGKVNPCAAYTCNECDFEGNK